MKKYFPIITQLLLNNKKSSAAVILSLTIMSFSEILLVGFIAPIYDLLTESEPNKVSQFIAVKFHAFGIPFNIVTACISLIISGLMISIFRTYSSWLVYSVKKDFKLQLSTRFINDSLNADYISINKENSGNLINILTLEMERAGGSLLVIFNFIRDVTLVIGLTIFLFSVSWNLLLLFVVIFLPLSLLIKLIHSAIEKNAKNITRFNRSFVKHIKEVFDNIKDIKSMNAISGASKWVIKDADNRLQSYKKSSILAAVGENIQHFIMIFGLGIIVIISTSSQNVSSSDIIILIGGLVRIAPKISGAQRSLAEFLTLYPGYQLIEQLSTNLKKTIKSDQKIISNEKINSVDKITFSDVYFKYPNDKRFIIEKFNCTIKKGEITAIIGESGSGKSTVLSMLLGLTKPEKGKITVYNNLDYSDCVRNNIGYLGQESGLFDLSVIDNINFFQSFTTSQIKNLIDEFQLKDEKYLDPDFRVGDKGINLSAGQRQRVLLIRALIRSPKFIFLDEATNNLDSQTEKVIFEKLKDIKHDSFIIVISHNPSIRNYVDKVIELK